MAKRKKKKQPTKRDERQAKHIMIGIGIVAVVLVVLMFIVYSFA